MTDLDSFVNVLRQMVLTNCYKTIKLTQVFDKRFHVYRKRCIKLLNQQTFVTSSNEGTFFPASKSDWALSFIDLYYTNCVSLSVHNLFLVLKLRTSKEPHM